MSDEYTYRYMLPELILKYFRDLVTVGDTGFFRNTLLSTSHWNVQVMILGSGLCSA